MNERSSPLRWLMISMVFLATAINYLDRQALSVAAPVLISHFHMTPGDYSEVIFGFMLAYTIMNAVSGPLIDRLGTRIGYALTTAWWSIAAMLHALSTGFWSLAIYRFLLGVGEAGNWPAGAKVATEWFHAKERALASGIFNSGSAFGAIIAPPLIVLIILKAGWRYAFVVVGSVGLIWVIAWLFVYRTPQDAEHREEKAKVSVGLVWRIFRTRFVWSLTVAKIFLDPVWYFYIFWFPEYLKAARHFNLASIGKYAWIPFAVAGVGNLFGGWVARILLVRGISTTISRKTTTTLFALLMVTAIPAVLVRSPAIAIGLVSIAMLGSTGVTANMLAFPGDVFPKSLVATIWGLASMGSGFGGMVFALATGWIVDHYSYVPVFVLFGLIPLIAVALMWFVMGPLRPIVWQNDTGTGAAA